MNNAFTKSELIDEYIKNSRVRKKDDHKLDDYYKYNYELICLGMPDYPELKICYSLNRICELVTIGNKDYLIYDRYLGQSLNHLMLLYYSDLTTEVDVLRYMNKCNAENYYITGQCYKAVIHAVNYELMMKSFDMTQMIRSVNMFVRDIDVMLQEMFIILHELYHWKLKRMNNKEEYIIEKRKQLISENPYKLYPHVIYPIYENTTPEKKDKDRLDWLSDDANIEEVLCDEYALQRLLNMMPDMADITIAESLILCIDNLCVLGISHDDAIYFSEENIYNGKYQFTVDSNGNTIVKNNPYLNRKNAYSNIAYRQFIFITVTCMNNLRIDCDPEQYLHGLMGMHMNYQEKIFDIAYRKNMINPANLGLDINKVEAEIRNVLLGNQVKEWVERIPKWGVYHHEKI